jgi:hypothetical protein
LGSVLSSAYQGQRRLGQVPAAGSAEAPASFFGGVAVAHRLGTAAPLLAVAGTLRHPAEMSSDPAGVVAAGLATALQSIPGRSSAAAARHAEPTAPLTPEMGVPLPSDP